METLSTEEFFVFNEFIEDLTNIKNKIRTHEEFQRLTSVFEQLLSMPSCTASYTSLSRLFQEGQNLLISLLTEKETGSVKDLKNKGESLPNKAMSYQLYLYIKSLSIVSPRFSGEISIPFEIAELDIVHLFSSLCRSTELCFYLLQKRKEKIEEEKKSEVVKEVEISDSEPKTKQPDSVPKTKLPDSVPKPEPDSKFEPVEIPISENLYLNSLPSKSERVSKLEKISELEAVISPHETPMLENLYLNSLPLKSERVTKRESVTSTSENLYLGSEGNQNLESIIQRDFKNDPGCYLMAFNIPEPWIRISPKPVNEKRKKYAKGKMFKVKACSLPKQNQRRETLDNQLNEVEKSPSKFPGIGLHRLSKQQSVSKISDQGINPDIWNSSFDELNDMDSPFD